MSDADPYRRRRRFEDEREQVLVVRRRAHAEGRALQAPQEILIGH